MDFIFPLLILFMIGLLFVSTRQRKKQQQTHDALTNSLDVGDVVVMTSGISGTIVDVDDEKTIDLEIAPDVITTWLRGAVREKLGPEDAGTEGTESDDADHVGGPSLEKADSPAEGAIGGTPTGGDRANGDGAGSSASSGSSRSS